MARRSIIGLIPARSGSKRLPNKNKKKLSDIPLICYTIAGALKSGIFCEIVVSTDDPEIVEIAQSMGMDVPSLRPSDLATDSSPDFGWVMHALENQIAMEIHEVDFIAILRPTNPFRSSESIQRAFGFLADNPWADSLRAMQRVKEHPGKMWVIDDHGEALPFWNQTHETIPTYNRPTQSLPELWVQNASLEIARTASVLKYGQISGSRVLKFEMPGWEGLDINTEQDWLFAEYLLKSGLVEVPRLL
jgi:CMP-N,N'-diacetyllegionaminic acid synthase